MTKKKLPYRHVHLDFHTSPAIPGIGAAWDKAHWQETLQKGHVNSICVFAKCHHGWSYHPTNVGKRHPHLDFDLLKEQVAACREIGVAVPIYLSAGVDNLASVEHPEWREVGFDGSYVGWTKGVTQAGFHSMDFHSPYLDYLCEQIREVVELYPDCDGIFLDIISQHQSCGRWALEAMEEKGLDPENEQDRLKNDRAALLRYYQQTTAACQATNPDMPVFHNSGHIRRGERDVLPYFSHLELESLPTGGWGYDHFPLSIAYARNLGFDTQGMTGKFHTTWGEFGGYKHPNALRYECDAMIALGSKCAVGDQLHPDGLLDGSTYEIIGEAFADVERKEPWVDGAEQIADIAVLSSESVHPQRLLMDVFPDVGAARVLLEGHFLFDFVDAGMDLSPYKMVVLPDDILLDYDLNEKLQQYAAKGGKVFMTGESGLAADRSRPAFDLGVTFEGESPFQPDFILPVKELRPAFVDKPMVMYAKSQRIKVAHGGGLGEVYDPYFNRSWKHFCSHQHAPAQPKPSGYDLGVQRNNLLYLAHPVFSIYRQSGAVVNREFIGKCLRRLLGDDETLTLKNFPSTARVSLARQEAEKRTVLHLLYAAKALRGGAADPPEATTENKAAMIEVIEELTPLHHIEIDVRLPQDISRVTLEPEGRELSLRKENGRVQVTLDSFTCHQMVVFHDAS